jgi:hypothetical protein
MNCEFNVWGFVAGVAVSIWNAVFFYWQGHRAGRESERRETTLSPRREWP